MCVAWEDVLKCRQTGWCFLLFFYRFLWNSFVFLLRKCKWSFLAFFWKKFHHDYLRCQKYFSRKPYLLKKSVVVLTAHLSTIGDDMEISHEKCRFDVSILKKHQYGSNPTLILKVHIFVHCYIFNLPVPLLWSFLLEKYSFFISVGTFYAPPFNERAERHLFSKASLWVWISIF